MTAAGEAVVVDTSVVLKWFHADGESEIDESSAMLDAHTHGRLTVLVLDLTLYELGNILMRTLRWEPSDVADQLDDLDAICGPPLVPDATWHHSAAHLAAEHSLTFYDASFAACAAAIGARLVSADRQLLFAGVAASATATVNALSL